MFLAQTVVWASLFQQLSVVILGRNRTTPMGALSDSNGPVCAYGEPWAVQALRVPDKHALARAKYFRIEVHHLGHKRSKI